ncbi:MAG: efflux RND transporter periplasmic adaptor subunit [Clostridiales bacterium]|jgi:HlyD family secretion protein|nr:efflux RND transporter periplasmic adaptor subunit [Clostridiales bacterium]
MNKKIAIFIAIVAVAIVFIGINILNSRRAEQASGIPRNATPVNWAYPEAQTVISTVSARGSVELRDKVVVFPETQAQILTVHVKVGDEVEAGDVLITYDSAILEVYENQLAEAQLALRTAQLGLEAARIAPTNMEILSAENQIEQARSNISSIEAALAQNELQITQLTENIITARNSFADTQTLFESGVVARVELDNAAEAVRRLEDQLAILLAQRDTTELGLQPAREAERLAVAGLDELLQRNSNPQAVNQLRVQQIAIERAQLSIEQIEKSIEDFVSEEIAGVSGTVINLFVTEGEISVMGRPMLEIADISSENIVIVVHVPEYDAGNISVGQEVEISGRAIGNDVYDGVIERIHPIATQRMSGTNVETVITVEITVDGETRLRAGNTVDADIVTKISEDTLVVPLMSTLSESGGVNYVYLVTDDSTLERRDITLGEFSNMFIEVFGLEETSRVVSNPAMSLHDGMLVRPIQPLNAEASE